MKNNKIDDTFIKPHYEHYELTPAKGTIVDLNVPAPSGRIYSKEAMENAIKEYNEKPKPKFGIFEGELNHHPNSYLDLTKVSHRINDVSIIDNKVVADIDILDNDNAKIVKQLLELDQPLYLNPVFMVGDKDSDLHLLYTTISQYPSTNAKYKLQLEKNEKE